MPLKDEHMIEAIVSTCICLIILIIVHSLVKRIRQFKLIYTTLHTSFKTIQMLTKNQSLESVSSQNKKLLALEFFKDLPVIHIKKKKIVFSKFYGI